MGFDDVRDGGKPETCALDAETSRMPAANEPPEDLSTTQRDMHLSPAAIEGAIRLLEMEGPPKGGRHEENSRGHILETADA